jgi:hypothetical protein
MATYEINCPLCVETATVEIDPNYGIYRVLGFKRKPRQFWILRWRPNASHGEKLFIDRDNQTRVSARCGSKHYLRALSAPYYYIPQGQCLYGPERAPIIECPFCQFRYGTHSDFIHQVDATDADSVHVLRSITKKPKAGHTEVAAMTRQKCTTNRRLSYRKDCPNCGRLSYFNYRTIAVDPEVQFSGSEQTL